MSEKNEHSSKVRAGIWVGIIATLLVLAGIYVFAKWEASPPISDGNGKPIEVAIAESPANLTEDGGVFVAREPAKEGAPKVAVYIDFLCPACKQFEEVNGSLLQDMAAKGTISLEYRPIAILDRASTTKYSSRALNAFSCVADSSPEDSIALMNKMMEVQPAERTAGLSNENLAEHANSVSSVDVSSCITDEKFLPWSKTVTNVALDRGLTHTPFVVINDKPWDGKSDLMAEITKAGNSAP